jgi:hypothetical protein
LLNGCKSAYFSPSRGIRQGDPLFPYLFNLCSEILARLIKREEDFGLIKGVKLASNAPSISLLSYADDVLLFCGAKNSEIANLMRCVDKFCDWSRLSRNRDKSGVHS